MNSKVSVLIYFYVINLHIQENISSSLFIFVKILVIIFHFLRVFLFQSSALSVATISRLLEQMDSGAVVGGAR